MMNQDAAATEAGRRAGPPHPSGSGCLNVEDPHAHLVPVPATIRQPVTIGIGQDGEPLQVALWNPLSGAMTIAVDGDGPAAAGLLDSIAERVTACDDAALLYVTRRDPDGTGWAAVADAAGHAGEEDGRALLVLQFASLVIHGRRAAGRDAPVHVPTDEEPLWVLLIEDARALAADPEALALLSQVCMTSRSEGVAVVIAGQLVPGAGIDVRSNIDLTIDAAQLAGQAFAWPAGGVATLAASRAVRLPRQLEPALASLQPLLDLAAGHPIEEAPGSWAGDLDVQDDEPATPDARAAARPAGPAWTPAGSWYAAQADRAAIEVEDILSGGKCARPSARVTGHGLVAVTYALLAIQEAVSSAGSDVCDAIAGAGGTLAGIDGTLGDVAAAIDGLASVTTPASPRAPRRARRMPPARPGITYTAPGVLAEGPAAGWADPEEDPAAIGDWPARQARALIPFDVDRGRPVSPFPPTGIREGRNQLGLWGENAMADAIVTCRWHGTRYLLLVERSDGHGWAVPGGAIEWAVDATPAHAAVRELQEETGLEAGESQAVPGAPRHVPDPRASDEAWAVTVPCAIDLEDVGELPVVKGADDARRAEWVEARDYDGLVESLRFWHSGTVFSAHQSMLRAFLGGLPAVGADADRAAAPAVAHYATRWQHWLGILGVAFPRALCGEVTRPRPGQPEPGAGSPDCPACAAIIIAAGRTS
jgi:ADP-ribose pyrophosphatase YjhB (NUDIX family)